MFTHIGKTDRHRKREDRDRLRSQAEGETERGGGRRGVETEKSGWGVVAVADR